MRLGFVGIFMAILLVYMLTPISTSSANEIRVEIIRFHPDMVFRGCNVTYVYWPREVTWPNGVSWIEYRVDSSLDLILGLEYIIAKYNVRDLEFIEEVEAWKASGVDEAFKEAVYEAERKYGLYLSEPGALKTSPTIVHVGIYRMDEEKIRLLTEHLRPFMERYDVILVLYETIHPRVLKERQFEAVRRFYENGGWRRYVEMVREEYGIDEYFGFEGGPGNLWLYIGNEWPPRKEFIQETVSLVRNYTGCDVPLEIGFVPIKAKLNIMPPTSLNIVGIAVTATILILAGAALYLNRKNKT